MQRYISSTAHPHVVSSCIVVRASVSNHLRREQTEHIEGIRRVRDRLDKHTLTAVNLNHCSVHPPDMVYVAQFVADNAVLLTLDVSENHMLDAGASELAAALRRNTKLQSLALRDNGLTGAGLQPVFDTVTLLCSRFILSLAQPGFTLLSRCI